MGIQELKNEAVVSGLTKFLDHYHQDNAAIAGFYMGYNLATMLFEEQAKNGKKLPEIVAIAHHNSEGIKKGLDLMEVNRRAEDS